MEHTPIITNIESRPLRKQKMLNIFNQLNIPIEFNKFSVDKKYLISEDLSDICKNKNMTLGEIGCAISHFNMWNFSDNTLKIIHEDDILLNVRYVELLNKYLKVLNTNNDWDICLIGRNCFGDDEKDCYVPIKVLSDEIYSPKRLGMGMHGYILHKRAIKKLPSIYPLTDPIDVLLTKWHGGGVLNVYVVNEVLCVPEDFNDSDTISQ